MELRERSPITREPVPIAGAPGPGGPGLDAIQQQVRAAVTAADAAIRNVLSADSEQFSHAVRQQGGQ